MQPGDLTTLDHVREWLNLGGAAIAGITNATPGVVETVAPTGFVSGMPVQFSGVQGMTELNGNSYTITVIDAKHFSIGVSTFQFAAYTGGGFASVTDALLARLITAVSTYIQTWLNRTIRNLPYTETRSGLGMPTMMLGHSPVTSVSSLTIDGQTVPARAALVLPQTAASWSGYVFDEVRLMLSGWCFSRGFNNVTVSYAAGFLVSNEAQTIPASAPFTLSTLAYWNAGDRGVTYADGTALVSVTGAPAAGQYSVDTDGLYTFNAADAGAAVLISYGYVPPDIEQAAIDMIGDWFVYRSRIGKLSEAIEGQSISFTNQSITARAQGVLNQYRIVAPIW